MTLIVPDDDSRMEWLALILEKMLPLLQDQFPTAFLADGTRLERPSLLPSPGELEPGDALWLRLRRLARMGLQVLGPPSPESDELRLAFAYLAEDHRTAMKAVDALIDRAATSDHRLRWLSVRAQILLMRRDFDHARALIEYLRGARVGPTHIVEEGIYRPRLTRVSDPRTRWPDFLAEKSEVLRKPPTDQGQDLVPGNVLDLDGDRGRRNAEPAPADRPAPF